MNNKIFQVVEFIRYQIKASNSKGHGIHSPFLYEMVTQIFNNKNHFSDYSIIEKERKKLLSNQREIDVEDLGAGSIIIKTKKRKVKDIARTSLKPPKYAQLLYRLVKHYQYKSILELGTSLGITSAYLAKANHQATVYTFEGATTIATQAKQVLQNLKCSNVEISLGNFDETLPLFLSQFNKPLDFVFIDGNHQYEPTLNYFNQLLPHLQENSLVVLDDIHWSKPMHSAWKKIIQHAAVTMSVDLFVIGILIFRKDIKVKQDFVVRF